MKKILVALCLSASVCSLRAKTVYVDDDAYGKGGDGTEEKPYGTLQDAVTAAEEGDTVLVLPGTYDKGFSTYTWTSESTTYTFTNRVAVTKPIYLKSRDGAETTVILGAPDASVPERHRGVGPAAVRCVFVGAEAGGTVIEGFTLKDGCAHAYVKKDGTSVVPDETANRGGGATGASSSLAFYVTDSVFTGCSGTRGGALRFGTAVRCRFTKNRTASGSCVCRNSTLVNCLVDDNPSGSAIMEAKAYNCTFSNNGDDDSGLFGDTIGLYNCIVVGNHASVFAATKVSSGTLGGCVLSENNKPSYVTDDGTSVIDPSALPLFAPLFGDFRPLQGSVAEGRAKAAYLDDLALSPSAVHDVGFRRSLDGVALPTTGTYVAGCYQDTVTPAGGAVWCRKAVQARGYAGRTDVALWAFSETPQDVFQMSVVGSERIFRWFCYEGTSKLTLDGEMDDSLWCVMPPQGVVVTNSYELPTSVKYVGGPDASDTTGDGTAGKPFATIRKALEGMSTADFDSRLVHVAEGTYAPDATTPKDANNNNSCVSVGANNVRFLGAGIGKSIVKGLRDATDDGRGPNAFRCFALLQADRTVLIQGFTLSDGYANNETGDSNKNSGGLVLGQRDANHRILDCELVRGYAFRGSAFRWATAVRCTIHDCPAYGGAVVRPGTLKNSLIYDCNNNGGGYIFEATLVNCTVLATDASIFSSSSYVPLNCVFSCNGTALVMPAQSAGNILYNPGTVTCTSTQNFRGDPLFVDLANRDVRLQSATPALVHSVLPADYWLQPQSDVDGNPLIYREGKPLAGCKQACVQSVVMLPSAVASDCTVSPAAPTAVLPGESVTVTATMASGNPRTVKGFEVDGEFVAGASYVYTAPIDGSWTAGGAQIRPVVSGDWYVSPTGSNAANGWTPETAFETLTYAMSVARSGETVHALEGVHSAGQATATRSGVPCRVVIKDGLTLIGDAGAEKTVILGGSGVRPAHFNGLTGTLKGVTLTGGSLGTSGDGYDVSGGGVTAVSDNGYNLDAIVCDCVISNNVCARGGATRGCTLVNCRVLGNTAGATSGAAMNARLIGCYLDGNVCGSGQLVRYSYGIYNCTFGSGNVNAAALIGDNGGPILNSVILCGTSLSNVSGVTNCFFLAGMSPAVGKDNTPLEDAAAAKLDATGHPSVDSPLVDAGANALVPDILTSDLAGVQRVFNADVDVGAYEYDWRSAYAAKLGSGVTVAEASPSVKLDDAGVLIPDGARVSARVKGESGRSNKYAYGFSLATGAELDVDFNNGEKTFSYQTSGTDVIRSTTTPADFVFEATGGSAVLKELVNRLTGIILVVR